MLTEETIAGDRDTADGLTVGFRADSMENLHWINSFDYSSDETKSYFKRGEMAKKTDTCVYDDIRFTGAVSGSLLYSAEIWKSERTAGERDSGFLRRDTRKGHG